MLKSMVNFGLLFGLSSTFLVEAFVMNPRIGYPINRLLSKGHAVTTELFGTTGSIHRSSRGWHRLTMLEPPSAVSFIDQHSRRLISDRSSPSLHVRSSKCRRRGATRAQASKLDYSPLTAEDPDGRWQRLAEWAWRQGVRWGQWEVAETLPGIRGAVATSPVEEGEVCPPRRAPRRAHSHRAHSRRASPPRPRHGLDPASAGACRTPRCLGHFRPGRSRRRPGARARRRARRRREFLWCSRRVPRRWPRRAARRCREWRSANY